MLYQVLTISNVLGSMVTIVCLFRVMNKYQIPPRMNFYIYLSFVCLAMIVFGQFYSLAFPGNGYWVYKIPVAMVWLTKMYLAWALRFSLIKKK
jgi:hypothetical protein